ncbi:MAG: type I-C CRISPR-associated protein Cas8c/Csd1 [Deltaproteobacteria bacterium]|nr:type I-C CRISPR-associated protein Cas8c/Csd1 [Deltaproteobacteria bacterium]
MLRELTQLAKKLQEEGELAPLGYKVFSRQSPIRWILHLDPGGGKPILEGPKDIADKLRPGRYRSGKIGLDEHKAKKLKPYLLVDEARYALGISEPDSEPETRLIHQAFRQLLEKCCQETNDKDLTTILQFLEALPLHSELAEILNPIKPKDVVTFIVGSPPCPFERQIIQEFWRDFLFQECGFIHPGNCSICGNRGEILQTLPLEVVILGQKCQITSFNKTAFNSFGKPQTTNASLCKHCGLGGAQALDHLLKDERHNRVLARDDRQGAGSNPLRNQVAVFWLKEPEKVTVADESLDLLAILTAPIPDDRGAPEAVATLALLDQFLKMPWGGAAGSVNLPDNAFYLAILSANKGRLVVREWLAVSLASLRDRLRNYLQGLKIAGPQGEDPRIFPIPRMLGVLKNIPDRGKPGKTKGSLDLSPNLVRGLLRCAYLGEPPPSGLLETAVGRLRTPRGREDSNFWILASIIKLALTFKKEEAQTMVTLLSYRTEPAYLCGRLLAVLEETQRRSASKNLNTTIVDRYYGGASLTPKATLGGSLINLAEKAYLPKLRRDKKGHKKMRLLLEEILSALNLAGGFPTTLTLPQQAEFALGFYQQRADLRPAPAPVAPENSPTKEEV